MKKIVIKENDANQRIDKYLKKLLCNAPSNFIYKMFRKKDIKINGKKVNEKYPSLEVITIFFRTTFKPFLSICRFYRLFLYF